MFRRWTFSWVGQLLLQRPVSLYGSWFNKYGDRLTYFSGNEGENICSCGQADPNECYKRPHETQERNCNCDANQPISMSDSGVISNKVD